MSVLANRKAVYLATIASALALAAALATERFGGLVPCALCLWERWPYRIAIAIGLLVIVLPRWHRPLVALLALALALLAGAGLGLVHVGVEQHWWPSPLPECAAPQLGGGTMAERLARMPMFPAKPCDDPTYLIPGLPISMALMNMLLALALALFLAISAVRPPNPARPA